VAAILEESLSGDAAEEVHLGGDTVSYRRTGIQDSVMRKLRRGHYRVQAELDLHGLSAAQASEALREFLAAASFRKLDCVRIVHGKGLRSGHRGPVLKNLVARILRRTAAVNAFVSARQVDGGTGALYVLLGG
jgi:DNA-nicking Smr family endonuclease